MTQEENAGGNTCGLLQVLVVWQLVDWQLVVWY